MHSTKKRIVGTGSVVFQDGQRETMHVHEGQAQLKWPSTGVVSVRTPDGIFAAPPSYAVWIPAGLSHGGMYSGEVFEQNAYVLVAHCERLPKHCASFASARIWVNRWLGPSPTKKRMGGATTTKTSRCSACWSARWSTRVAVRWC